MKVAIVGAGVAGLSCAYTLDNLNIDYDIFCKELEYHYLNYSVATLHFQNLFNRDSLKYFKKSFNLKIKPYNKLKTIEMYSQNKTARLTGNLGYIFTRGGIDKNTIENQLLDKIKNKVHYVSNTDVEQLKKDYDYVVIATGTNEIGRKYGLWTNNFSAWIRVGKIVGNYKDDTLRVWFNKNFCKNGFVYTIPNNSKELFVILTVDNISSSELDFYWKKFLDCNLIKGKYISTSDMEQDTGVLSKLIHENLIFVGDSGGFCDNFLGFGTVSGIHSGCAAANHIGKKMDYEKAMSKELKYLKKMALYRDAYNRLSNSELDNLISFLGLPLIKNFVYKNPFVHLYSMTPLIKTYLKYSKKK